MPEKKPRKPRRSSAKPAPAKKPTPRQRSGWLRSLRRWLLLSLAGVLLLAVLYGVYLDQVVRVRFEGKRWSLPARVYARPLELYVGAPISVQMLRDELDALGYARRRHPNRPGAYSYYKERFLLRSRRFRHWDGEEASRYLEVVFANDRIHSMKLAASGAAVPLIRLQPPLIDRIYPAHHEDRILLRREDLPKLLVDALLAVEDRQFYQHHGLDPWAILRALWRNLRAGRVVQGGSTLTQQLVKNFYLSNERSLIRKLNEAAMSLLLDWRYDKDDILEAYANEIYLGQDGKRAIHGFGLGSSFYFNRPLAELDLPRIALLVGLIKGPSYYNPRRHPQRALQRRNLLLGLLAQHGVISAAQADAAQAAALGVDASKRNKDGRFPAFMDLVRQQLQRDYREQDLRSEGLSIFTTLDPRLQAVVEQTTATRLSSLERASAVAKLETAAVLADVQSGEVLALSGGRRPAYSGFNRALDALRPIGSLIKPVVYLEALGKPRQYTLISLLKDKPVSLKLAHGKRWQPQNFDGKNHGAVPLYQALAHSYNLSSVHLGLDIGLERVLQRLRALGAEGDLAPLPSLLLGAISLSPLNVAQIYQSIASGGFKAPLRAVRAVTDGRGKPLRRYPLEMQQVADPAATYLLQWAMQRSVEEGTARALAKQLPAGLRVAGKTGTTDDYRDSWFAGFSADKIAVVWIGRDDNQPAGLSGATGAMRLWGDIMAASATESWAPGLPRGVVERWVRPVEGRLADAQCDAVVRVPFVHDSAPRQDADCLSARDKANEAGFFQRFFQ
jgi:penicillin-binding protein 1B